MSKQFLARYIRRHCIEFPPKNEYFFGKMSGARYSSQFYLSRLLYNQEAMKYIGEEFVHLVEEHIGHWNFQLTGREWSAIPLLIALPLYVRDLKYNYINSFMIKRERKKYGIHNFVEGSPNKLPVLIVDDLCNSTNSFLHCRNVLKSSEFDLEVLPYIFAVLNKYSYKNYNEEQHEYYDRYLGRDFKALSILTRDDLDR